METIVISLLLGIPAAHETRGGESITKNNEGENEDEQGETKQTEQKTNKTDKSDKTDKTDKEGGES